MTSSTTLDPILEPTIDRFMLFPIRDNELWSLYKQAEFSFWTAEEIDLSQDMTDWRNVLTSNERQFISKVLAFFATADGIVAENVAQNFSVEVQLPEARYFYGFQAMIENVHAETYALLIETFIQDRAERHSLLHACSGIPSIRAKANWAMSWLNHSDIPFGERLLAFAAVEGIFFSSSFAAIFWLKKRGLMPGLSFSNELISRDEGLHTRFACVLHGKLAQPTSPQRAIQIIKQAVEIEKAFVTGMLSNLSLVIVGVDNSDSDALSTDLIGLNQTSMGSYVECVADCLLQMLGFDCHFNTPNPLDFMEMISLHGKTNFFEKRVSEYQRANRRNYLSL
ncbi:hypothetical protein VKT23_018169 [Stygiomarasmius scandens]|uniref:Uncharacterized protein n=1 Tax=Marasmiellus scandens TaxID=2682957 RepID=A0ABR1ISH6_9AGAR